MTCALIVSKRSGLTPLLRTSDAFRGGSSPRPRMSTAVLDGNSTVLVRLTSGTDTLNLLKNYNKRLLHRDIRRRV